MGDNARLIAVIPDREFRQSRDEVAALSRRLTERLRSPLLSPPLDSEHVMAVADPATEHDPGYLLQIAPEGSQALEIFLYGRYLGPWPGYRLLAEWLKHHLACEVYLGSSYGHPWVSFDAQTIATMNQGYVRAFCEDTHGASHLGLPWPSISAKGADVAVIAGRFRHRGFDQALASLRDILAHHRKYQGQVPIPPDGPAMAVLEVLPDAPAIDRHSVWCTDQTTRHLQSLTPIVLQ
jgi:hypothetical protein